MDIRIDVIQGMTNILECISIAQIQHTTAQDEHLQHPKIIIITGWLSTKDELHSNLRPYCSYRDYLAVIDNGYHTSRTKAESVGPTPSQLQGY